MDTGRREATEPLALDAWLALVREAASLESGPVTRDEQLALLDLTRVAAHRSERIAAPITAFAVGVGLAGLEPAERALRIRRLTAALDLDARNPGGEASGDAPAAAS